MSEKADPLPADGVSRRLADAIRDVKNAAADRSDVVVELREATRMRLDLLAAELAPVFAEVPADVDLFDFTISTGLQPRLWIDAVAHVAMGRDRRTYRFVRDTRVGRIVLAESAQVKPVADHVARYVAERLVERERQLDGAPVPAVPDLPRAGIAEAQEPIRQSNGSWREVLQGIALLATGALMGAGISVALLWDRIPR